MSTFKNSEMTVQEARQILTKFSCLETQTINSESEKQQLRQALLLISNLSDTENLGICADNVEQGFLALSSYLKALEYPVEFNNSFPDQESPVYIKFNGQRLSHLVDTYSGKYRGVLVSCQSEDDLIMGTYGHFPLDLFES